MGTTKNMQFLRTSNRAAIIKALALGEASNRVELSSHLGLSKMAMWKTGNILPSGILPGIRETPAEENPPRFLLSPGGSTPLEYC